MHFNLVLVRTMNCSHHFILGHKFVPFIALKSLCICNYPGVSWVHFGLSKNERPILDHHAKAHNFEIWRISWNPVDFTWNLVDFMKSLVIAPTLHSSNWRVFAETLAVIGFWVNFTWNLGEIHQISWVKSTGFHGEIRRISKDQLPGMVSPMFLYFVLSMFVQSFCHTIKVLFAHIQLPRKELIPSVAAKTKKISLSLIQNKYSTHLITWHKSYWFIDSIVILRYLLHRKIFLYLKLYNGMHCDWLGKTTCAVQIENLRNQISIDGISVSKCSQAHLIRPKTLWTFLRWIQKGD